MRKSSNFPKKSYSELDAYQERKNLYENYRNQLEEPGESQISTTDHDSRLMKTNEGFCVGYNVQTKTDAESHLIADHQVTNKPTGHGKITSVASEVKADYDASILESTADKGYEYPEDHAEALDTGIALNVIRHDGGCTEIIEFEYNGLEITDGQKASTRTEDLKACLEAGIISNAYEGILSDVEIKGAKTRTAVIPNSDILKMTPEQMQAKTLDGYSVRDAARNLDYCPQGKALRQKSTKRNGNIRYRNKLACKRCRCKCTSTKFKEADFRKNTLIKAMDTRKKQEQMDGNRDNPKPPKATMAR